MNDASDIHQYVFFRHFQVSSLFSDHHLFTIYTGLTIYHNISLILNNLITLCVFRRFQLIR